MDDFITEIFYSISSQYLLKNGKNTTRKLEWIFSTTEKETVMFYIINFFSLAGLIFLFGFLDLESRMRDGRSSIFFVFLYFLTRCTHPACALWEEK